MSVLVRRRPPKSAPSAMIRLPSASNFIPFDMPLGERKIVACLDFGSYCQMLPACRNFPDASLHSVVKVMSLKYTKPWGLVATPSVNAHAPPNTRSSFAPEGSTLGSPFGAGNPGSSAHAAPTARAPTKAQAANAALVEDLGALPPRSLNMIISSHFFY